MQRSWRQPWVAVVAPPLRGPWILPRTGRLEVEIKNSDSIVPTHQQPVNGSGQNPHLQQTGGNAVRDDGWYKNKWRTRTVSRGKRWAPRAPWSDAQQATWNRDSKWEQNRAAASRPCAQLAVTSARSTVLVPVPVRGDNTEAMDDASLKMTRFLSYNFSRSTCGRSAGKSP